ncbi:hypothetical protein CISG_10066 [Coccidioides immitis RMSCC 3703]|uniref:Uncharacterized protein n=1 Tax=Coccidioides immitis RMSCC 3703 TaxID=454286 RepID=A0A0J8QLQ2_COCIT|nr:hypothetical protein CISG_10066 [Coccidioides immitis RMSCC 3703]
MKLKDCFPIKVIIRCTLILLTILLFHFSILILRILLYINNQYKIFHNTLITEAEVIIINLVRHYLVQKYICHFSDNKKENQTSRSASLILQNSIMQEVMNLTKNNNINILFEKQNSDTRARSIVTSENTPEYLADTGQLTL